MGTFTATYFLKNTFWDKRGLWLATIGVAYFARCWVRIHETMRILLVFISLLSFGFGQSDNQCGADLKPKKLAVVGIWTRRFDNSTSQFRISDEDLSVRGYERSNSDKASSTVMLARHPEDCIVPDCGVRLTAMIQKNGAILHTDNTLLMRKNSEIMDNIEDEYYCAKSNGSCGADVPVYRLVKHSLDGPHYAYSFDTSGQSLPGYEKEFFPICYAWRQTASVVLFNSTDDQLCLTITPINNNSHILYNTNTPSMLFYPIGTTAALNCPDGYIGTGPSNIVCTKNGWYPKVGLGQCVKQHLMVLGASSNAQHDILTSDSCPIPTTIPNGNIVYSANVANITSNTMVPIATRASVLCNIGFVPSTSVTSSKCIDSTWQPTLPSCLSIFSVKCPIMSSPMNGELIFSNSSADPYSIGSVINLICNRNYFGIGNMSSECVDGEWTRRLGRCEPITSGVACSALSTPTYGNILYMQSNLATLYSSGTTAYLMCNLGYTLSGSISSLCTNGAWSPTIGTCAVTSSSIGTAGENCTDPSVSYGTITYSSGTSYTSTKTSGTVATLTCNSGYSASGTTSATCLSGSWFPTLGTCTTGTTTGSCSNPSVSYGTITYSSGTSSTSTKTSGTVATLTCNSGYTTIGSTSSTCLSGTWFPAFETCTSSSSSTCTNPTVLYGVISYSSGTALEATKTSGTRATLTCDSGFTSSGTTTSTCTSGSWSPALGTCNLGTSTTGTNCTDPSISYGTITYSTGTSYTSTKTSGTVATLTCNSGYTSSGTTSSTCLSGTWFPTFGTCTSSSSTTCTNPTVLYGVITYSSGTSLEPTKTSGTRATLTCDSGFTSSGTTTSTCTSGSWYPALGTCNLGTSTTGTNCTDPSVSYGTITYSSGTSYTSTKTSGTVATLTCNSGYTTIGSTSSTCLSGTWFPAFETCTSSSSSTCTNPTVLYGLITYSSGTALEPTKTSGTRATLTCDSGFTSSGTTTSTCSSGSWSPALGTCNLGTASSVGTNCTDPSVSYGTITYSSGTSYTSTKTSGTVATLTCNSGYSASGTTSATCLSGSWFPTLGTCTTGTTTGSCTDPSVSYGTITYSSGTSSTSTKTSGTVATLTCNSGYTSSGTTSSTCLSGTWFPTFGTCTSSSTSGSCTIPTVTNGVITFNQGNFWETTRVSGTTATVTCNLGYTLSGNSQTSCESGRWSPTLGTCTSSSIISSSGSLQCTMMLAPLYGTVSYSSGGTIGPFSSGTVATATCSTGSISGTSTATCTNGMWSPTFFGTCSLSGTSTSTSNCSALTVPTGAQATYIPLSLSTTSFASGTIATVICTSTGTSLGTSTCTSGTWSNTITSSCTSSGQCSSLTRPTGETVLYNNTYSLLTTHTTGTVARIECSNGTTLATTTCYSGTWTPTITTTCSGSSTSCSSAPTYPIGATVTYSSGIFAPFTSGTTATMTCPLGETVSGTTISYCEGGIWTPSFGTCSSSTSSSSTSECYFLPTAPLNGEIVTNSTFPYVNGTHVSMKCNTGYTITGTTTNSTCINGLFTTITALCVV